MTQTEECRGLKDELDDLRQAAEQVVSILKIDIGIIVYRFSNVITAMFLPPT